jgi:hypothetical protein
VCSHAPDPLRRRLWLVLALGLGLAPMLASGCDGGQSGNEGDIPAPPCAGQGALFQARVVDVGGGSVRLEVDAPVKAGAPILGAEGEVVFSGEVEPGDMLRGKLGTVYAWSHEFAIGEPVAVLAGTWGDLLEFQLMPMTGDRVIVQWTSETFESSLEELASEDCSERLSSRVDLASDVRVDSGCGLR